ncbi:Intraflagellar transport protein 46, partial [Coelomomyces lativittatus]
NQTLVEAAESPETFARRLSRPKAPSTSQQDFHGLATGTPSPLDDDEDHELTEDDDHTNPLYRDLPRGQSALKNASPKEKSSSSSSESINELQTLFSYISQYKPDIVEVEPILFPFLPEYMPSIGDLEAMIKIPAPTSDPFFQDLGLTVLDEPAAKQSDPAVLHYQLKSQAKTSTSSVIHQIPYGDTQRLDAWIQSTLSPEWLGSLHTPKHRFPSIDVLMDEWDFDFDPTDFQALDLTLQEKIKVMCAILCVPIYPVKDGMIQSMHCIFELYAAFLNNQHFGLQQSSAGMSDF